LGYFYLSLLMGVPSLQDELREIAERCVAAASAHVIDLIVRGDRDRRVVELYIDAEGPVTTELCAGISRTIAAELDARTLLPGRYRLDVSSPGIDRPLRFRWQYKKHIGRKFRVALQNVPKEQILTGSLTSADDEGITLTSPNGDSANRILWPDIGEATVVSPW
jgi:ribosome maturation factor RimP